MKLIISQKEEHLRGEGKIIRSGRVKKINPRSRERGLGWVLKWWEGGGVGSDVKSLPHQ
jgi:hypothetical protein